MVYTTNYLGHMAQGNDAQSHKGDPSKHPAIIYNPQSVGGGRRGNGNKLIRRNISITWSQHEGWNILPPDCYSTDK